MLNIILSPQLNNEKGSGQAKLTLTLGRKPAPPSQTSIAPGLEIDLLQAPIASLYIQSRMFQANAERRFFFFTMQH